MLLTFIVFCAVIGLIPAMIAYMKGRSFLAWWVYGATLFLVALVHAIICEDEARLQTCPACAENVRTAAILCRYCGATLPGPRVAQKPEDAEPIIPRGLIIAAGVVALVVTGAVVLDNLPQKRSTDDVYAIMERSAARTEAQPRNARLITEEDFGDSWPFTVAAGMLRCEDLEVTFESGGRTYAVNGRAITAGYPEIEPVWKLQGTDNELPLRMNISSITRAGLSLCDQ